MYWTYCRCCAVCYSVCWRLWRVGFGLPEVMRRMLLSTLEAVEGELCLLEVLEMMHCMRLCMLEAVEGRLWFAGRVGDAGGDAACGRYLVTVRHHARSNPA